LTFARPGEQQHVELEVSSLLREVVQLVRRTFDRTVVIELDVDRELWVRGDRALLFQALMNLCLNARDAMPMGGRLEITGRRGTRGAWESVVVEVSDSGAGIDERALPRLFEPFYTTKDGARGTGLGLAMVYGTVRGHGGDIDVTSRPGRGTTFAIWLPNAVGPSIQPTAQDVATPRKRDERASRILIVDDEPLVRRSVQRILRHAGHEVMTASNGAEAVELYERHTTDIGIVLLDLSMPVMTGREALAKLKALNPNVRVVVLSAYAHDQKDALLAEGVYAVLDKPCDATKLREVLESAAVA
jgi:CheY-like chemotaxis protein